jgi:hypothetical protein
MNATESLRTNQEMKEAGLIVKESIDQSMRDLLGGTGAEATLFHVGLSHYESETREFHVRLYSIFRAGSATVERMIVRDLYKRLNLPFDDWLDFDYEKSVAYALKVAHERVGQGRRG